MHLKATAAQDQIALKKKTSHSTQHNFGSAPTGGANETHEEAQRRGSTQLRETCRNHHWGLLNLCQPESLEVLFYVTIVDRILTQTEEVLMKGSDDEGAERNVSVYKDFRVNPIARVSFKLAFQSVSSPHRFLLACCGEGGRGSGLASDFKCPDRGKGKGNFEVPFSRTF